MTSYMVMFLHVCLEIVIWCFIRLPEILGFGILDQSSLSPTFFLCPVMPPLISSDLTILHVFVTRYLNHLTDEASICTDFMHKLEVANRLVCSCTCRPGIRCFAYSVSDIGIGFHYVISCFILFKKPFTWLVPYSSCRQGIQHLK